MRGERKETLRGVLYLVLVAVAIIGMGGVVSADHNPQATDCSHGHANPSDQGPSDLSFYAGTDDCGAENGNAEFGSDSQGAENQQSTANT